MAPTVESHGRRIILESDPYVGSWRRKQAQKGIIVTLQFIQMDNSRIFVSFARQMR